MSRVKRFVDLSCIPKYCQYFSITNFYIHKSVIVLNLSCIPMFFSIYLLYHLSKVLIPGKSGQESHITKVVLQLQQGRK